MSGNAPGISWVDNFVFRRIKDPRARQSVLVELKPAPETEAGVLSGTFDIVLRRNLLKT